MTGEVVQFQRPLRVDAVKEEPPSYRLFAFFYVICALAAVGIWDIGTRIAALWH